MISQQRFEDEFLRMVNLCSLIVKKEAISMYYESLKHMGEAVFKGIEHIIEDPPNKLTLRVFKDHIRQTTVGKAVEDWTGVECSVPKCNRGLISERIVKYYVLFRCTRCNSSRLKFINSHTPEQVFNEQQKQIPVKREKELNRIETLSKSIG